MISFQAEDNLDKIYLLFNNNKQEINIEWLNIGTRWTIGIVHNKGTLQRRGTLIRAPTVIGQAIV